MKALVYDNTKGGWSNTRGMWLTDLPKPSLGSSDTAMAIIKLRYAGFCGSDRGIWARQAFGELIESRLQRKISQYALWVMRCSGKVVAVGQDVIEKYGIRPGDIVSAESHNACGTCYQCVAGDKHVCVKDSIIGISEDGCFAEYAKLPARVLWPTDIQKIDPRVARHSGSIRQCGACLHPNSAQR